MKWIWVTLFVVVIGYLGLALFQTHGDLSQIYMQSPCNNPITYSIGSIDSRFDLSESQAETDISEAADIWSQNYGKVLFKQSPKAKITISFIYDQRQKLDSQIRDLQGQLDSQNQDLQNKINSYKNDVVAFRQKVKDLNDEIQSWNAKGGAPAETYDNLVKQQSELKSEADSLNARAKELNLSTEDYNSQVGTLNQDVSSFNHVLAQKPEEGLFDPNDDTISIYFVNTHDELVHTLAHELGHSLSMQHVQNDESIMYPDTSQSVTPTQNDLTELSNACRKQFVLKLWSQNLVRYIRKNFVLNKNV